MTDKCMGLDDEYEASFDFSTILGKTVDVISNLNCEEQKQNKQKS